MFYVVIIYSSRCLPLIELMIFYKLFYGQAVHTNIYLKFSTDQRHNIQQHILT